MSESHMSGALSRRQLATLAALADILIPHGGPFPLGATDVDTAGTLSQYLMGFPPATRRQVAGLISAWEYSTLLTRHLTPFSRLDAAARQQVVEQALHSHYPWRRFPLVLLTHLCGFAYGAAPEVEAALGFDHSCIDSAPPQQGPRLSPLVHPQITGEVSERVDVCIIGSGAGGAVVAKELAEAGLSVLIIEEGDYFTQDDFHGPPFARAIRTYREEGGTMALGRPLVPLPLGKAVGGTTVINSGTCFRTPDKVLRRWESDFGLQGYDSATLAPLFDRIEETMHVMPVPWEIIGKNAEVFDRGVRALGLHGEPIRRNIKGCRGCGACAFGCPSDAKQAMHLSYLPLACSSGARIFARCRAEQLVVEHGRAVGVEAAILDRRSDEVRGRLRVRADTVVVAAGTIHTPLLLRANRLGRRSGQLGRNLRLHPALGVQAIFDEELFAWRGTLQSYYVDHLMESDEVLLEVTNPMPTMASGIHRPTGMEAKQVLAEAKHVAATGLFVSDTSSGRVLSLGKRGRPIVLYSLNDFDAQRLIRGVKLAAQIFLAAGARRVRVGLPGLREVTSPADLAAFDRGRWRPAALAPTGFHPMGTCRMSPNPDTGVVDLRGQVHGTERLFVADGSIFPTCTGVNPQESIMAFATRIAQHIKGTGN